jgi:hypothetical protein
VAALVAAASACDTGYSSAPGGDGADGSAATMQVDDAGGATGKDGSTDASPSPTDAKAGDASIPAFDAGPTPPALAALGSRLRLWLDATDPGTLQLMNGSVATWTDKSALHLVATTQAGAVTWANDADAGGVGAISISNNGYLSIPSNAAVNFANEAFSAWAVVRFAVADIGTMNNNIISKLGGGGAQGSGGYALTLHVQGGGPQVCGFFNSQACAPATEGFATLAYELSALVTNQTLTVHQIGDPTNATTGKISSSTNPLFIGATQGPQLFFHGTIYEIIIASAPSANESTAILSYLTSKYGR